MVKQVSYKNFRSFKDFSLELSPITMLTGNNSVGKTSVLEGLYCLFSASRIDVSYLPRIYKLPANLFTEFRRLPRVYNYKQFWDECPYFGYERCSVKAESEDGRWWEWSYKKANLHDIHNSEINPEIIKSNSFPIDMHTQFALFNWKDGNSHSNDIEDFHNAQALIPDGGRYFISDLPQSKSNCFYFEFSKYGFDVLELSFDLARKLVSALQIINPQVTDIRLKGLSGDFSVVLNDKIEVSLATLGHGSVIWVNALLSFLHIAEFAVKDKKQETMPPTLILIDELGTGIHYSIMLNILEYIKNFRDQNPNIQFVFTSHSDDCIRAYCEVFSESELAKVVRLHKKMDDVIVPTYYTKEYFENIISDNWEVRG